MEGLFSTMLDLSIRGSVVIAAVLLGRLLLKKAPAVSRFALWALVAVALLIPVRFESPLSLMPAAPEAPQTAVDRILVAEQKVVFLEPVPQDRVQTDVPQSLQEEVERTSGFRVTVSHIWAAGIALMLLWTGLGWLRLRRKVIAAVHLKENIYLCDHIPSPFVLGVLRPRIYLPSELPEEQRDLVLAHERGHIFRWDHFSRLLGWGILVIHWFNPLVWLSFVLFCRDMEMACDEWVIRELDKRDIRRYSEALIGCGLPKSRLGFHHLAFGEVSIKARVKNILRYKKPAVWISLLAVAVAAVVAVCFLTERPEAEPLAEESPQTSWTDERAEALEGAEFGPVETTRPENPGYEPPLELTGALSEDGASALADFRDGTGYQFFSDEAQELVRLLNALTAEDFVYEPELSPVMAVTLTASGRDVHMESDTELVILVHDGIRWGIRDEALSEFFRMIYSVTGYEEQNVVPLQDIREHYSMEEAMIDLCVIQEDGQLRYNTLVWEDFYTSCEAGTPATVRIWDRTDGVTCVRDLSFDGKEYCLHWYEDGQLCTEKWQHLHCFSGDAGEADRYRYHHYILTDDPDCTWDEGSHSLHHSQGHQNGNGHHGGNHHGQSGESYSGHHKVCSSYSYYPNHPFLPDTLDKAELVLDGKVIIATVVPESLARLEIFFEVAEETYEPKTYNLGPELVLWFREREEPVHIVLDLNNDLCIIDGTFYDYGPGYTDDGSYNALQEMLACFSITEWPQPVKDKYGDYIWW